MYQQSKLGGMNMDWSKTKSIFIGVFLILNVFLYSQYLNTYNEAQKLELLGTSIDIEARLKEENITYATLAERVETAPYISAKVKKYTLEDLPTNSNQNYILVGDDKLVVTFKVPIKLASTKQEETLNDFLRQYVYEGQSFELWEIDEEARTATFFQHFNGRVLYYNENGKVKIYWNENGEVLKYEQSMLENIEEIKQNESILLPIQVLQTLYAKNLLKPDSHITTVKLGYSTLIRVTPQVLTPTWKVRVQTSNGEEEQYFVNAIDGKLIDITQDIQEVEEE